MSWRRIHPLIQVDVNVEDVRQEVNTLRSRLSDMRPAWRRAGTIMRKSFAQNFQDGGRPDKWAKLSPNTVASKQWSGYEQNFPYAKLRGVKKIRRLQQGGRRSLTNILIARGDLRDSYAQKNANHVSRVSKDGFEEGSKHWLAAYHEFGTQPYIIMPKRARRLKFMTMLGFRYARSVHHPGLPARPAALVQPEDEAAIMGFIEEYLNS